jgi:hypothetical protein
MTWLEAFTLMWISILEIMIEDQQDHDNICNCAFLFYKPQWKFIHKFPQWFMEIFFHGDQMQNKHSTSCALSALLTLNSNLEKILIFTKHSICVVWRRCANLCEGSSKKTWNKFKSSKKLRRRIAKKVSVWDVEQLDVSEINPLWWGHVSLICICYIYCDLLVCGMETYGMYVLYFSICTWRSIF